MRTSKAAHPFLAAARVTSTLAAAKLIAAVLTAAMFAAASPLRAQQAPDRLPDRLQPTTRAAVEQLADSLRAAGLPDGPLYAKAAEGVLKGASDARIIVVVRSLARELGDARLALGPDADQAALVAGASALHAGVPAAELRRMHARQPRGTTASLAVPLTVLADLITRGVPPDAAASSVNALLARSAADAEFKALRVGIERDITAGRPPGAAAQAWTQRVLEKAPLNLRPGVPRHETPDRLP